MDSQTKLTPDQIAGFEARAKNGERPALEWCHWPTHGTKEISVLAFLHDSAIRIYWPSQKRGRVSDQFYLCFGVHDGENSAFASGDFSNIESAQLAAEHLLAEATRPLHKGHEVLVLKSLPADVLERMASEPHGPIVEYDPNACFAAKDAEIDELKSSLASRDGELAALRDELKKQMLRGDEWKKQYYQAREAGSLEQMDALIARAEAAEARARELEGLNAMEVQRLISANDAAQAREEVVSHLLARVAALEAALAESVSELMNIANVDVSRWDPIQRPEFRAWAQNRARFTLKNLEEARTALDAARAGGQG